MRKLWNMRWFRVLFGVVLTAALLAPVVLPALQMQQKEPENPIRKENIQPVRRLSFGDGDGGTLAAAPLSHEDSSGGGKSEQEQQPEQPPEENTDETPEKSPEQPQPTPEPQPGQASSEQPGEETGGQTDDAGDEAQPDALDLGLVLSWYRYGGERYRSICPADTTVRQDVRTAQLPDGYLRYELDLRGLDAVDTQITGVQLSENNGAYEPADVRGSIEMQVGPQGEDSYYTLRVQAVCTHVLEDGTRQEQETEFCFVLVYSDELDLEAQLQWNLASGGAASLRCQPGRQAARTVKSDEISENLLRYSFRLGGESAEDAKILSAEYRSADGQSGTLQTDGGALTLQSDADGKNTYTIALLTEINSGGRTRQLTFTFLLEWQEEQDIRLNLVWMKNSTEAQSIVCEPGDRVSAEILRTELKLGEFSYRLEPDGRDAEQLRIISASLAAEGGAAQTLAVPDGSTVLRIPDGAASIKYTLTVQARYQKSDGSLKNLTFTYVLRYSGDVSLELRYTLLNGTQTAIRCANGQNKTAQTVYSDEVTDGVLAYTLALTGGDAASGVEISDVSCYQSGSGRTKALGADASGQIELLVNEDGSEGENTFTVTAKSAAGEQYTFRINVPYKLRGDGKVIIETNLTDGQKVMNGTEIMLTVSAWSEKEDGTRIAQMTASDTVVTLDGVVQRSGGASGDRLQYKLVPENPAAGDENEHTLVISCEDAYGNSDTITLTLLGERTRKGEPIGHATIYIDMTVLGLGVTSPLSYEVLSGEPASYSVAKAVWGYDAGDPFGTSANTFGWPSSEAAYNGSLDSQFYLKRLGNGSSMGTSANALHGSWSDYGSDRESVLAAIDGIFGENSPYAALWRSIYLAGISLNGCHDTSVGEFDFAYGSGWLYSIGGGTYYPTTSLADYELQDGDVLVLRYTLAYGRDVGSGDIGNAFCVSMLNGSLNVSHQWSQDGTEPAVCASCGKIRACEHPQTEYRETEDGTMCYEFCLKCQKAITDPELHDWQITPIEQNDEQHSKTCRRCEKQIEEEHRFEFIEDTATCKQEGETVSRCMDCGYEKREPSEKLSHRPAIHVSEQEHWEECEVCGEEIEDSRAEHRYEWDDGLQDWACTCGYTHKEVCKGTLEAILDLCTCSHETTRCSGCGKTFERDAPGAFDYPHSYEIVVDECTCSLEVKQCVYCGDKTEQPGTYENYPHSYVDGFCRFCGAPEPVTPGPDPDPDPNPEPGPEPDPGTEEGPEE